MWLIILLLIIGIILFLCIRFRKKFKFDTITMWNGAVGAGKTSSGLYWAIRQYKHNKLVWNIRKYIRKYILHKEAEEKPLLYSNIPLYGLDYVPLQLNQILRNEIRFNYKSVVFIDESSLIADSMDYKDKDINNSLSNFLLFFRHETKGGSLHITTQSKNDNHFAFDRKCSGSMYITKSIKIPFFKIVWLRELLLIDSRVENTIDDDFKESIKNYWFLLPKSIFKKYDSYCYSILSDNWKSNNTILNKGKKKKAIKTRFEIITLHKNNKEINNNNEIYEKENNNG